MKEKTGKSISQTYKDIPILCLILQIVFAVGLSFWILFNNSPTTGDDVEHIHSSWLVFQGKIPYIDFFQHHNPLLWYLFAPLVGAMAYDLAIFDIVRICSTLVLFATLGIVALIVRKFVSHSKHATLIAIASVFPSYVIFSGQDFRPDNYMVLSFMTGLYFYFSYLENKKSKELIISFFCMFLSFMFMQKIIFIMFFWGLIVLWHLYKKDLIWNDVLKALILPLVGMGVFIGWLFYHDMVIKYWLTNYIFNLYIPDVYWGLVEKTKPEFYVVSLIAFLGTIFFILKGNKFARIIAILWLAEAGQRFFYFSLDRHYYYLLHVLNSIMAGAFIWEIVKRRNITIYIFLILSLWGTSRVLADVYAKRIEPPYHRYVTPKYVLENTNRCDSVLNGYGLTYGIYNKDITYYWNLNGQLDVIGNKIGLAPLPNLNKAVLENLPKIIYTDPYWDEKKRKNNQMEIVHLIDDKIRDKYYDQSVFVGIFILKPQYQEIRRCRYNSATGGWEYFYKERP